MKWLDRLERKFGDIPNINITYYLIFGQIFVFFLVTFYTRYEGMFTLRGDLVMQGQYWRIITFIFEPITRSFLFAAFTWYIFYMYGTVLEKLWGTFRYLVYILIVTLGSIIISFIFPYMPASNGFIFTSIFLAFAYLFPDYQLLLFFILPVKVKWLALITWIGVAVTFIFGDIPTKVMTLVSVSNFLLFFGDELFETITHKSKKSTKQIAQNISFSKGKPEHVCSVCGKNNIDNPDMGIRYCSKCTPETCFCEEHFLEHVGTHAKVVN